MFISVSHFKGEEQSSGKCSWLGFSAGNPITGGYSSELRWVSPCILPPSLPQPIPPLQQVPCLHKWGGISGRGCSCCFTWLIVSLILQVSAGRDWSDSAKWNPLPLNDWIRCCHSGGTDTHINWWCLCFCIWKLKLKKKKIHTIKEHLHTIEVQACKI